MPLESSKFKVVPTTKGSDSGYNPDFKSGYHQELGTKVTQEDGLCMVHLLPTELLARGSIYSLLPEEIGHRLWTMHLQLNKEVCNHSLTGGSTASSVVYNGHSHIISANLGDSASFALVFDAEGEPISVTRINSMVHNPKSQKECYRVSASNGSITRGRLNGRLAITRTIGDDFGALRKGLEGFTPLSSYSCVDILDISSELPGYKKDAIVKIMVCSDGFTDGLRSASNKSSGYESYLFTKLNCLRLPGMMPENELAKKLSEAAKNDRLYDNISVGIQTIRTKSPFFIGCYDGHGGAKISTYLVNNAIDRFIKLCTMSYYEYTWVDFSATTNKYLYDVDNEPNIRRCSPLVYSILYPLKKLELVYILNCNNLSENKLNDIKEILEMIKVHERDKPILLHQLISSEHCQPLKELIAVFKKYECLDFNNIPVRLINHPNIQDFWLVISQVKDMPWFQKNDLLELFSISKLNLRAMAMKLAANLQQLDRVHYETLLKHKEPDALVRIFQLAEENGILTLRNMKLILNVPNITEALTSLKEFKNPNVIIWGGPTLHNVIIKELTFNDFMPGPSTPNESGSENPNHLALAVSFQKLNGMDLYKAILEFFRMELMEVLTINDLDTKIQQIKSSPEYKTLISSQNRNTFFSNSNNTAVFLLNDMIDEQKTIIKHIEKLPNTSTVPQYSSRRFTL